jgi:AraC-like DNA-binding protein
MIDRLYEIIFFISTFLYLLFVVFLFTHKKGNRLSNQIFAGFCLLEALLIISDLGHIFRHVVYKVLPPYIEVILESVFFLMGPFLYFYTRSMSRKDFIFKKIHLWHLIPFFLDVTFRNYRFFSQSNIRDILIERGYFISYPELKARFILADIHVIFYIVASLLILYKYRSELKELFSSIEKIKLSWLSMVLFGFFAVRLFHLSKLTLSFLGEIWINIFGLAMHLGALLLATVVVFRGLRQPEIFSGIDAKSIKQKYAKTALSQEKMEQYLQKLTQYMEAEKPYLNPSLNINELASKLSVPAHYISQILNRCLNQNFYHFVNKYRIEESKRVLIATVNQKKTVLEILYETGFNSKSTFNSIFKQYTGMTPTQFINAHKINRNH